MTLWKQAERKIASLFGGRRIPVSGRQRGDSADIEHDFFSIEVKHRQALPTWILDALDQSDKSRRGDQKSIAVFHQKGMKYEESLAILRLCDILSIYEEVTELRNKIKQTGG